MMTRAKRKERVRMDRSGALMMAAHVVDGQPKKNHWVLAVLDIRKATCYNLDSLRPITFLEKLKQVTDMAMVVMLHKVVST
ncbi:hypothetical protein M8C21_025022 [Ambrosia artemisiifolia]|uniref:Ubiquitin-like protease family profile domain-containing protein n=1 Tax=Ambrosia artemisiifolia TaxID=4212 RepID=A0AAD5C0E6_AMBAR|nr:hypothetical protein M8C21_025022 [Ambrosia artemisiifolia]